MNYRNHFQGNNLILEIIILPNKYFRLDERARYTHNFDTIQNSVRSVCVPGTERTNKNKALRNILQNRYIDLIFRQSLFAMMELFHYFDLKGEKWMEMWKKVSASALAMTLAVSGFNGSMGEAASNHEVTRGEYVKSMIEAMGVELGSGKSVKFKDVPESLKPFIEKAIELKLVQGKSETIFAPNEKLNREQAFVIASHGINRTSPILLKYLISLKIASLFLVVFEMI